VVQMLRALPEDVEIVFAGGGEEQGALERHVRTHGLSNRIRILGDPLPDQWSQLYAAATFVILPNLWNEPLGLSALQALAYGKPVVAFRGGGITEWIENGINGITVPFGARTQFQQTVVQLLNEPEKLKIMGKNAEKIWKARFHPNDHLTRLRSFYAGFL
jgi:glycosyltransferase involved in cell wall biosynthesis